MTDPTPPALTRDSLGPRPARTPELKRHRMHPFLLVFHTASIPVMVALGAQVLPGDTRLVWWFGYVLIGISVTSAMAMVAYWFTYTEIGPQGILVRRPPRQAQLVSWSDLAQVAWVGKKSFDRKDFELLVLSTKDGRQVETVGVAVASPATDRSRKRALRMLEDIKQAWAASGR